MSARDLKARLAKHLSPAAGWAAGQAASRTDFDLNPGLVGDGGPLRPAAVLIPIIDGPDGATVLMTRRSDALASHTGQIAFPGGRLDLGETAVQAALREAQEEVALDPAAVEVLGLGDAYATWTGFIITPVIGWLATPPLTTPSPDEVAEVFEVPWDFLMDPVNHRQDWLDRDGQRRFFWAMPYGERYIWGITAAIVRALRDRLYDGEDAVVREDAA